MAFLPGQIGGGSGQLTPEQVERLRLASQEAASRGADTSPVAHWAAALARGIDAYGGYRGQMRANEQEAAGDALAEERVRSDPRLASALGLGGPEVGPVPSALTQSGPIAPQSIPQGMPSVPGSPMVSGQSPNAEYIRTGLLNRGVPEHVADAFILNFQDESGLNPGINEANPIVPGSRGGFGLYQLTGPRRREYEAYAAQRGVPVDDVDAQLDFMMQELQGSERAAAEKIFSAPDTGSAAAAIVNSFLRPAEEHRERRVAKYTSGQFAQAPQQAPSANIGALAQAQADPWVAKKYGGVIDAFMQQEMARSNAAYEAQLAQQDPMYQAQLQQQQLQNEAMMNPAAPEPVFQGGQWWDISSGQPQPLTQAQAEQTAAQQNYEFLVSQGMDPQTAMDRAFSGGTTVNVGQGENEFAKTLGKGRADKYLAAQTAGADARRRGVQIDQLEANLASSPSGLAAMAKQNLGEWGIKTDGLSDLQAAQAMINQLVPQQRPAGSGPMSDADLEMYKQSLPRLINSREGNQLILQGLRAIQQYDAQIGSIADQVINGNMTPDEGDAAMAALANPLEGFSSQVDALTGGGGQSEASVDSGDAPAGIDPSDWEYMTPEERALFQ